MSSMTGYIFDRIEAPDLDGVFHSKIGINDPITLRTIKTTIEAERLQDDNDIQLTAPADTEEAATLMQLTAIQTTLHILPRLYIITDREMDYSANEITLKGTEFFSWLLNREAYREYKYTLTDLTGNDLLVRVVTDIINGQTSLPTSPAFAGVANQPVISTGWDWITNPVRATSKEVVGMLEFYKTLDLPILKKGENILDWLRQALVENGYGMTTISRVQLNTPDSYGIVEQAYFFPLGEAPFRRYQTDSPIFLTPKSEGVIDYKIETDVMQQNPTFEVTYSDIVLDDKAETLGTTKKTYRGNTYLTREAPWQTAPHIRTEKVDTNIFYDPQIDPPLFRKLNDAAAEPTDYAKKLVSDAGFLSQGGTLQVVEDVTGTAWVMLVKGVVPADVCTVEAYSLIHSSNELATMPGALSTQLSALSFRQSHGKMIYPYYLKSPQGIQFAYVYKTDLDKEAQSIVEGTGYHAHVVLSKTLQVVLAESYLWSKTTTPVPSVTMELSEELKAKILPGRIIIASDNKQAIKQICTARVVTHEDGGTKFDIELTQVK